MLKIGRVKIENPFVLAPMAGVCDVAFRVLCRRAGAGLVYSEMINSHAICRNNKSTLRKMIISEEEHPVAIQLFGSKKDDLCKAAKIACENGADMIDLNLGCPDPKVISQGAGAALLRRPSKIAELVSGIVNCVDVPVSAKIRIGIHVGRNEGLKTAKIIEKAGASAIAVHGRFVEQGYSGKADWDAIREIADNISIPVIGNGDVFSYEDAVKMLEYTHSKFVMVGRAAIGNPLFFRQCNEYYNKRKVRPISKEEKLQIFYDYLKISKSFGIYHYPVVRRMAIYCTKGIPNSCRLREEIGRAENIEKIIELIEKEKKKGYQGLP